MKNPRVLISGASIAGPSLAYWLQRYGFVVTLVEKADKIRCGGQPVDFKGPVHLTVLERMGLLDAVRQASVPNDDGILVNALGQKIGVVPGRFAGGEINIPRGKLVNLLYELTSGTCEYIFKDTITSIAETSDGVHVTFASAAPRTFDLIVGADGIHSNVRRLTFGPESDYVTHLGYYYALADLNTGPDDVMYNEPGIMVALAGLKGPAFFVFASALLPTTRDEVNLQKAQLTSAYKNAKWRLPELLNKLPDAKDFYMDSISRVVTERYASGRVVLVGDAAYGNALGGFGTGLAIVGAYVLAGELFRTGGDYRRAFLNYQKHVQPYASISQKVNAGQILAPTTRLGIRLRNLLFSMLARFGGLIQFVDKPATNIKLENYLDNR